MRTRLLVVGLLCLSTLAFGQKKEIRNAGKALKKGDISEAISYINQAEGMLSGADADEKAEFNLIKAQAFLADAGNKDFAKLETATEALIQAEELDNRGKLSKDIAEVKQNLATALQNGGIDDQRAQRYDASSDKFLLKYKVLKDTTDLYNAAFLAFNGKNYEKALGHYKKLMDMGYTGIRTEYLATDIETNEVVSFATKEIRDTYMLSGKYTNPDERIRESVQDEMVRTMTDIYINLERDQEALELIRKLRKEDPEDISLLKNEAYLAFKMEDMDSYTRLMDEATKLEPNNPELYYNMGVVLAETGKTEEAIASYKKALEADPDYINAKLNIAVMLLGKDQKLVEEMNGLGMSKADEQRYDELKEMRNDNFREVLTYLEPAAEKLPNDINIARTLVNVYSQLGDTAKLKAAKEKVQMLEQGQ